jgi:hypothetical protein
MIRLSGSGVANNMGIAQHADGFDDVGNPRGLAADQIGNRDASQPAGNRRHLYLPPLTLATCVRAE